MPPVSEADVFVQGTWQPGVGESCYRHVMWRYVNRVVSFFDSLEKKSLWTFLFRGCTQLERVGTVFLQRNAKRLGRITSGLAGAQRAAPLHVKGAKEEDVLLGNLCGKL